MYGESRSRKERALPKSDSLKIEHPEIGVCGLSCLLCPMYHSESESRCAGCKSEGRMQVGCAFITCAVKKRGIEFCWDCQENESCEKWLKHRAAGHARDSFKCYQTLDTDIEYVQAHGIEAFIKEQKERERILKRMLEGFNEGRSRSRYCVAATVLPIEDIKLALAAATKESTGMDPREKAKVLRRLLDEAAARQGLSLALRK
jgi:hypothetical protein